MREMKADEQVNGEGIQLCLSASRCIVYLLYDMLWCEWQCFGDLHC